jgi:hypothetical protein
MSAFDAGSVIARLGLDTTEFLKHFAEAHTHAETHGGRIREILESIGEVLSEALGPAFAQFGQQLQSCFAGFSEGPVIGGLNLISEAIGAVREATEAAGAEFHEMGVATERAGVSVEWMSKLAAVGKTVGVSIEELGAGFRILEQRAAEAAEGNKATVADFEKVGISATEAARLMDDPAALFDRVRMAIAGISDPSKAIEASLAVLGRQGQALIPIFKMSQEEFRNTGEQMQRLGGVVDDQDAEMGKAMGKLEGVFDASLLGIERAASRPILKFIQDHFEDLEKEAESLTAALTSGLGRAWDVLEASAQKAWPLLHELGELIEKHSGLVVAAASAAAGVAAFGSALTGAVALTKLAAGAFTMTEAALKSVGVSATGAISPVMAVSAAIGVLAAAEARAIATGESFSESLYKLTHSFQGVGDSNKDVLIAVGDYARLEDEISKHLSRAQGSSDKRDQVAETQKAIAALEQQREVLQDITDLEKSSGQYPTAADPKTIKGLLDRTSHRLAQERAANEALEKSIYAIEAPVTPAGVGLADTDDSIPATSSASGTSRQPRRRGADKADNVPTEADRTLDEAQKTIEFNQYLQSNPAVYEKINDLNEADMRKVFDSGLQPFTEEWKRLVDALAVARQSIEEQTASGRSERNRVVKADVLPERQAMQPVLPNDTPLNVLDYLRGDPVTAQAREYNERHAAIASPPVVAGSSAPGPQSVAAAPTLPPQVRPPLLVQPPAYLVNDPIAAQAQRENRQRHGEPAVSTSPIPAATVVATAPVSVPSPSPAAATGNDVFSQKISGLLSGLKDGLRDSYREALVPVVAGVMALVGAVSRQAVNPQLAGGGTSSSSQSSSGRGSQSPAINQPLTVNITIDPREVASQVANRIMPIFRDAKTRLEDQIASQSRQQISSAALGGSGSGGND